MKSNEMKHTPGPWKIVPTRDGPAVTDQNNRNVLNRNHDEQLANIRLIVAACNNYDKHFGSRAVECAESDLLGELLKALKSICAACQWKGGIKYTVKDADLERVRQAIARAEGRE